MIKLNLARNCLRYIIRAYNIKELYVPYYSCNSIWHAIKLENCKIRFYHIDSNFLPTENFPAKSFILYINYFGLCTNNCKKLEKQYPNLIVDNTHAFYSKPMGLASFNSIRKFFTVQNGAYLFINKNLDEIFETDYFLFKPATAQNNYEQFLKNELLLDNEDIKYIYPKLENELIKIDFDKDKNQRLEMYYKYHTKYREFNQIQLIPDKDEIPYCYPLSTNNINIQKELMNSKYPLLKLWGNLIKDFSEYDFLGNTVALPLDTTIF